MRLVVVILSAMLTLMPAASKAQATGYTWTVARYTYVLEPDGRYTMTAENERKAHDAKAARDGGRMDLTYAEGQQKLEILEAVTIKADGRRIPVTSDRILDIAPHVSREVALYTDLRTRSIVFPDLQAGDSIRYVYRLDAIGTTWPGFFAVQYWRTGVKVDRAEHIFDHPDSMLVTDEHHGTDYRVEAAGGRTRRIFSWSNPARDPGEAGSTSPIDWGPRYALTTLRSYAEVGDSYGRLHVASAGAGSDIAALAADIVGSTVDRREQARLLYDWVTHNIRYVAVSIGQGKLSPTPAAETLSNRYGDCKAQVVLLAALLAARGIPSEPALINAFASRYSLPEVPVGGFNHVILYLTEFDLYVDPTAQNASFGVLPWGHYSAPVLHAVVGSSRLARVPVEQSTENVQEVHVEATVSPDGKVTGRTREIARGAMASDVRSFASNTSPAQAMAQLRQFGSPGTGKWLTVNKDPANRTVELESQFELGDRVDLAAGEALVPPLGLRFSIRPGAFLFGLQDVPRRHPFPCHAGRQVEEITVRLPSDLRPARLPTDRTWKTSIAEYRSSYRFAEDTLHVRREFISTPASQVCRVAQSAELVDLMSNIRRDMRSVVVFDK